MDNEKNEKIITTKEDLKKTFVESKEEIVADVTKNFNSNIETLTKTLNDLDTTVKSLKQENFDLQQKLNKAIEVKIKDKKIPYGRIMHAAAYKSVYGVDKAINDLGSDIEFVAKGMTGTTLAAGGALIKESYANDITPMLQANAILRQAGVPIIPMPTGNLIVPAMTSAGSVMWVGDVRPAAATAQTPAFSRQNMNIKVGKIPIAVPDSLVTSAGYDVSTYLQNEMIKAVINAEDYYFIQGDGSQFRPKGLTNWISSTNSFSMTSPATVASRKADLIKCRKLLLSANANQPMSKFVWLINPIQQCDLESQVDSNSNATDYARQIMELQKLFSYPIYMSNNVPSGTVILVDISQCLIGEGMSPNISVKPGGGYYDGTQYVTGDATGETVFTAEIQTDFLLRTDLSGAMITSVTWGV